MPAAVLRVLGHRAAHLRETRGDGMPSYPNWDPHLSRDDLSLDRMHSLGEAGKTITRETGPASFFG